MPPLTKLALRTLIASVVISAALGIAAILSGDGGWHEARILLTTATISGASICTLACAALWERRQTPAPLPGIALALSSAVLVIAGIWAEFDSEWYWKCTVAVVVFAIASAHLCLLSLAHLASGYRWALAVAAIAIFGLATIITWMVVAEEAGLGWLQLMGVTAIVVASMSILIPIFHRLSAAPEPAARPEAGAVMCPWCGTVQTRPLGEITCAACGCVFVVRILQPGHGVSP
jgi:hypothetical protein